jgi:hypothetical protein
MFPQDILKTLLSGGSTSVFTMFSNPNKMAEQFSKLGKKIDN